MFDTLELMTGAIGRVILFVTPLLIVSDERLRVPILLMEDGEVFSPGRTEIPAPVEEELIEVL